MPVRGTETSLTTLRKILAFAAIAEIGTSLALMIAPAIVAALLLGAEIDGTGARLGRCFGIALLALGVACWPSGARAQRGSPAVLAMLLYNALIAAYLAYLGAARHLEGLLLWPAVALHAAVTLWLAWAWRGARAANVATA